MGVLAANPKCRCGLGFPAFWEAGPLFPLIGSRVRGGVV